MSKYDEAIGQKFNHLTVLKRAENTPDNRVQFLVQCDCNGPYSQFIIRADSVISGHTKSCGCIKNIPKTHGLTNTIYFNTWNGMMDRCNNPNNKRYYDYGGRGITVCEEWQSYPNFMHWAEETKIDPNTTLDRIDNNLGYSPDNCRWATNKEQMNNRRNNVYITYFGETHTLSEWCMILNLPYDLIENRLRLWGDFWRAISTPLPDHYYEDCYDYDYSNEYYEDPYEYDNYIYDE